MLYDGIGMLFDQSKVIRSSNLEIPSCSKSIFFVVYSGGWQMINDF